MQHQTDLPKRIPVLIVIICLLAALAVQPASAGLTPGMLDTGFDPGSGANANIRVITQQTDGKILIGGEFTTYNTISRPHIARLNADGSLDTTFNPGTGTDNTVCSIAVQPDGKILIGGFFSTYGGVTRTFIARLNHDGTLDTTFNSTILGGGSAGVFAILLEADGKMVIAGYFTTVNGISRKSIARLNSDGSLDTTFTPGSGASNHIYQLVRQDDGKILVGGAFSSFAGLSAEGIARINSNGTLDASFNPGTGTDNVVDQIIYLEDEKIIITGRFENYNGSARKYLARLNSDGSLDAAFSPPADADNYILSASIQNDGKILIGGTFENIGATARNRLARLNSTGSLDTSFDPGSGVSLTIRVIKLITGGQFYIGGDFSSYNTIGRNRIARVNPDGSLDNGFDTTSGAGASITELILLPDSRILIGGAFTSYKTISRNHLARLRANGTLDTTFDPGAGANDWVLDMDVQTNGKVVIGGQFTEYDGITCNHVARVNTDGSRDITFGVGIGPDSSVSAVALWTDKIYIGGYFENVTGASRNHIARLFTNGSLDLGFDPGTGANNYVYAIAVQTDFKVIIGGWFNAVDGTTRTYLARLDDYGELDTTFNPSPDGPVYAIVVQPDQKIVIGGYFTHVGGIPRAGIARLNANGSVDLSFDPGSGTTGTVYSLALLTGNRLLAGGAFTTFNGLPRLRIVMLHSNGSVDQEFNTQSGPNGIVSAIAVQPDGKVLIGGSFNQVNSQSAQYVARLNGQPNFRLWLASLFK